MTTSSLAATAPVSAVAAVQPVTEGPAPTPVEATSPALAYASVEVSAQDRKDWGISFNAPLEAGGVLVSEKVTLEFEISAVKAA